MINFLVVGYFFVTYFYFGFNDLGCKSSAHTLIFRTRVLSKNEEINEGSTEIPLKWKCFWWMYLFVTCIHSHADVEGREHCEDVGLQGTEDELQNKDEQTQKNRYGCNAKGLKQEYHSE